jgi:hypothetical protein
MRSSRHILTFSTVAICAIMSVYTPQMRGAEVGNLKAGAAKVDITPSSEDLPEFIMVLNKRFTGIHDHIYARAVVMDNGINTVALVSLDLAEYGDPGPLQERIQKELGIPVANIIIGAINDHNAPRGGPIIAGTSAAQGRPYSPPTYIQKVDDSIVEAVKKAKASLEPARVGIRAGHLDLNAQRYGFDASRNSWNTVSNSDDGVSDKTFWAVKLASLSGEPIAIVMDYSMHPIMGGQNSLLTGDLSGVAERFVEEQYNAKYKDDKTVALWMTGAGGDQSPKLNKWHEDMRDDPAASIALGYRLIEAEGLVFGSEALELSTEMSDMSGTVSLEANQISFTCAVPPKQAQQQGGGPGGPGGPGGGAGPGGPGGPMGNNLPNPIKVPIPMPTEKTIRLSLIAINQIAIAGLNAEVYTDLYLDLRKASPLTDTIMDSLANGRIGYLAADQDYDTSYKSNEVARGCAEKGIVSGFVGMMNKHLFR